MQSKVQRDADKSGPIYIEAPVQTISASLRLEESQGLLHLLPQ